MLTAKLGRAVMSPILPGAALRFSFALGPRSVARNLGRCEHDCPRWGAHTQWKAHLHLPRARRTGFYHGVGALAASSLRAPALRSGALSRPDALSPPPLRSLRRRIIPDDISILSWGAWPIGVGRCCPSERALTAF